MAAKNEKYQINGKDIRNLTTRIDIFVSLFNSVDWNNLKVLSHSFISNFKDCVDWSYIKNK